MNAGLVFGSELSADPLFMLYHVCTNFLCLVLVGNNV